MCECMHHVPGRIRFRIPALRGSRSLPRVLRHALMQHDGVDDIETRNASCSLVIHYDPMRLPPQQAALVLGDMIVRMQPVPVATPVPAHRINAPGAGGGRLPAVRPPAAPRPAAPAAVPLTADPMRPSIDDRLATGAARYVGGLIGRTIFLVLLQTTVKRFEAATQRAIIFAITGRKPVA